MEPFYQHAGITLFHGDSFSVLKELEPASVHCCVTSPPYWNMRDYHVAAQLGMEDNPFEYVAKMVALFELVRRVLRDDGTLWINIGDTYASRGWGCAGKTWKSSSRIHGERQRLSGWRSPPAGLKRKDLVGIPWRLAFALQEAGWYLRSEIVWQKPNALPEAVHDRPAKSHEKIFLLSKKEKYYYDYEAVKVPTSPNTHDTSKRIRTKADKAEASQNRANHRFLSRIGKVFGRRHLRDVWTVATAPYKDAHFATFPPDLILPCILAGCPKGGVVLDPFVGSGTTCFVSKEHGRGATGIDLNRDYLEMGAGRLKQDVLAI